jgi:uncharacterized protein (TIGR03437 family)
MLKKLFCASALIAGAFLAPLQARNIFVTAGDSGGAVLSSYTTDPFSFVGSISAAPGSFTVLAAPSGTKYYVVGKSGTDTVVVLEGTFPTLAITKRLSLGLPGAAAAITPDGKRLVVATSSNTSIIDTATDTQVTTVDTGFNPVGVAVNLDGTRAYVLSSNSQKLTAIDLTTNTIAGTSIIPGTSTGVAFAPNGLVYASAQNAIYEIDPRSLAQRAAISLNALPGTLSFTPDGRFGLAVNRTPTSGSSILVIDLQKRITASVPNFNIVLDKVVAIDNGHAIAVSVQSGKVYQILLDPTITSSQAIGISEMTFAGTAVTGARDIAISEELPQARYIYVETASIIYRYDTVANQLTSAGNTNSTGNLSYAGPASTGSAASIIQYNTSQTVASGDTSLPVVIRALDANGRPTANAPITFSTTTSGVSLVNASTATNVAGYATANVLIPSSMTSGTIPVTAVLGGSGLSGNFQIAINSGTGGGTTPSAGGIQIVSGQGQVLASNFSTVGQEPFTIVVKDANGAPVPGVPITWTLTGEGGLDRSVGVTDTSGQAQANFTAPAFITPGTAFLQSTVNASTGTDSVNFFVTSLANQANGTFGFLSVTLIRPEIRLLTGKAGQTLPGAVQVQAIAPNGQVLPNVGVRIVNSTDATLNPPASCKGGYVLTDSTGTATCDVVLGGTVGDTIALVRTAGQNDYPITIRVTPGDPTNIKIVQGNGCSATLTQGCNQPGNPGRLLPLALVAEVTDAFSNLLPGTPVTWKVVTAGGGTLSNVINRADTNGRVSASLTLGTVGGPVQVSVTAGTATGTFTVNANATISSLTASNDNQSAQVNQAFSQPLTVRVLDDKGSPVAGVPVSFTISSGSGTLSGASATTDANGNASVNLTAGNTAGNITVQASAGGKTASFSSLTVRPPGPTVSNARIVNGAGFQPGISPGSIAALIGSGISNGVTGVVKPADLVGPLPTTLAGVQVLFNGIIAPMYAVSNVGGQEQIVVQVPFEVQPGTATVEIRTGATSQTLSNVTIQALSPGVFETTSGSSKYAVVVKDDGSFVSAGNPARRGDRLRAYANGLGQVNGGTGTNRVGTGQSVLAPLIIGLNNAGYPATAEYVAGVVGLYVVTFTVPSDVPSGSLPFVVAETDSSGRVYSNTSSVIVQ